MYRQQLVPWIIASAIICAGLGAWAGQQLGDGRSGNIALVSAAGAVLGSFLPGAFRWVRARSRSGPPHHDAA
ncbi:MAG TPA: hypothetical protein VEV45_19865 [Streptosporangiaceae bacterium]|nr:hypothetical protein [Streptosporangiaceae bacterium]